MSTFLPEYRWMINSSIIGTNIIEKWNFVIFFLNVKLKIKPKIKYSKKWISLSNSFNCIFLEIDGGIVDKIKIIKMYT